MPDIDRLTRNSDETNIDRLIAGDKIFSIPYFQRPYKWKQKHLDKLNADILSLVDDSDFHFLGAIIIHGRGANPADPSVYDVIDGQQRITTLFLYVCALVKTIADLGDYDEAIKYFLKYLVINRDTSPMSNLKIHPCREDRAQLNAVYQDLLTNAGFRNKLGSTKVILMQKSGDKTGTLIRNYKSILQFLKDENEQGGYERIKSICSALLKSIKVVQIDVFDPTKGPKIFDSLNSRQEPMTIGDLVRNEVFSRVASRDPDVIERIDIDYWQPFYKKFEQEGRNLFDGYFFPYGLTKNPNVRKSEVYDSLKEQWEEITEPELIIRELSEYQNAFVDIQCATNLSGLSPTASKCVARLRKTSLPSSVFPFLMQLIHGAVSGDIDEGCVVDILEMAESFLVRRAVCGHEPTGLHAVFKRLWADCDGEYTASRISIELSHHRTVAWPSDDQFKTAIAERRLYGSNITHFLVLEYDRSLRADNPGDSPWIEHVLPQNPATEWFALFTREQHESYKDRLANLIPLSSEMNSALQNSSYAKKRSSYQNDSMFKSARKFAEEIEVWNPEELEKRGAILANWAVSRWPHTAP